jgi:NAD(P)-dependent dehydrogenase (short-subunit alcohol dehydrogenase family)
VNQAIETFGGLDVLVNNAGILRDGMVFSIEPELWESVIRVHLMGHFLTTRYATEYWRKESKNGSARHRSIINTTSESGLFGNAGQSNYDTAKMGIVSFTVAVAKETAKYNVNCNVVAPRARTRLTTGTFDGTTRGGEFADSGAGFDAMDPENIAPFVGYLATDAAADITGQCFILYGGAVGRVRLPHLTGFIAQDCKWTIGALADRRDELFDTVGPSAYEGPRGYAKLPRQ